MAAKKTAILFYLIFAYISAYAQSGEYFFYPAKTELYKNRWILLLPGSGGLTIFDDSTFYYRKASYFNQQGYNVLLVDYKAFYQHSNALNKQGGTTGEKISWVIRQVIQLAKVNHQIDTSHSGHLVGWSMGGEGIFRLLQDTPFLSKEKIQSVALFYPSNNEKVEILGTVPLLIQIGESDRVTNADQLKRQISDMGNIKFITYANCFHGFDVESLAFPKSLRFPPVIGKKHKFLFDKECSEKAYEELELFLSSH